MGIANKVVPDGKLIDAALEYANIIVDYSPLWIDHIKQVIWRNCNTEDAEAYGRAMARVYHYYDDCLEGQRAFIEKRKPKYTGT